MISPVLNWVAERTELNENLSAETLKKYQLEKLRNTINYARKNSKLYSETLKEIDTDKIRSFSDLQKIPFTRPEDIADDPVKFLCVPQHEIARIVTLLTSGSLGLRKRIYFTQNDMEKTADFFAYGMSTMVKRGQIAAVFMSGQTKYSIGDMLKVGLERIGVIPRIHGNIKDYKEAYEDAKGAHCYVGLPSEMLYLSRTYPDLCPESVLLSADYVPKSIVAAIEKVWNCKVFTHYGMTETGFGLGVQCEEGAGYHLRDADFILEIIDPETEKHVEDEKYGEVVITTISREAMPLIRYRTGDMGRMINTSCSCGGNLPTLDKILGRFENSIKLKNNNSISIHELDEIMFNHNAIRNYIPELSVDESIDILNLKIDSASKIDEDYLTSVLKDNFGDIKINFEYGDYPYFVINGKRNIRIAAKLV